MANLPESSVRAVEYDKWVLSNSFYLLFACFWIGLCLVFAYPLLGLCLPLLALYLHFARSLLVAASAPLHITIPTFLRPGSPAFKHSLEGIRSSNRHCNVVR